MHASIIVLSALVAVSTGQFWHGYWGGVMPMNPYLGVPMDEPAVRAGKIFNAEQHAMRGSPTYIVRKRRDVSQEAPAAAAASEESAEPQPEKRQILAYSGLGLGYGLGGWASPYYGFGGYSAYPYLFRKRRDVSEDTPAAAEQTAEMEEGSPKEKRQLGLWGAGWGTGLYSPYMRSGWGHGIYSGYPYLYRKRRDTSETESPEAPAMEDSKEKRQIGLFGYGAGYGWGYPSAYSGIYSPWGRSAFLWRKRRSTDSEAAPAAEESTNESRNKRQFIYGSPLAYSAAYTPYMMGYSGWSGLGYRGWW